MMDENVRPEESGSYRELYEREKAKAAFLADRVAQLEDEADDLRFKLDRIKNNKLWKASKPARDLFPPGSVTGIKPHM